MKMPIDRTKRNAVENSVNFTENRLQYNITKFVPGFSLNPIAVTLLIHPPD